MTPDEMSQLMAMGDEPNSSQTQAKLKPSSPQDKESWQEFWNQLKQGHLMQAGQSFPGYGPIPGNDTMRAAMTGALGPLSGPVAAATATVSPLAGAGGSWGDRYKQAQGDMRDVMTRHPKTAAAGGLASGILMPVPGINGGASVLGKTAAGALNGALQGGATTAGLGEGAGPGALIGGALGGAGGAVAGGISKAANSETLSPLLNRLKFLKPQGKEAEAGGKLREAISSSSPDIWKGTPSREEMVPRMEAAQAPSGQKMGDILKQADASAVPAQPDMSFPKATATLGDLLSHSASSNDNPVRLQSIMEQEGGNATGAQSFADLNKVKQGIYDQTYKPNSPDSSNFLPGRDELLRAMGLDVKNSIQNSLNDLHNIDPSIDAEGFAGANKQYGNLAQMIGPLKRATGLDIAGGEGPNLRASTSGHVIGGLSDLLNLGGKRYLGQAHLGEMLQGTDKLAKSMSTFKPSQAVAKAFIAGNTPGLNQEGDEAQ